MNRSRFRRQRLPAAGVETIDQLRRAADLFEDFLLQSGALGLEALRLAEHSARAILLPALQQGHAEVHQVRRSGAEVRGLAEEVHRVAVILPFEVHPAERSER